MKALESIRLYRGVAVTLIGVNVILGWVATRVGLLPSGVTFLCGASFVGGMWLAYEIVWSTVARHFGLTWPGLESKREPWEP
jgi:hypothetical protein